MPSTDGKLVGKLPKDAACEVIETKDGWCHIKSGEVDGYVSREFLHTGPEATIRATQLVHTVAIANTDGLNVRQEPNTSSEIVTQVGQGEEMEYVETGADGWVKISIDGEDAYVSQEFVTVEEKLDTAITMTELLYGQGVSDVRVDLVEYAKQFVGNPYVWGGTSLTKGADCSGFVLAVFKKYGIALSHSSRAQANEGTKISASDLKPGDLIFYGNGKGNINHVAIYIGGGQVIHASSPKTGIKISSYKYRTPVKVCFDEGVDIPEEDDEEYLISEEAARVRKELNHLSFITREVLIRFYFGNQSIADISKGLDIPEGTVKSRLSAGRDHMKKGLETMEARENCLPGKLALSFGGSDGLKREPISLVENDLIAQNLLILAYEKPITISELSKAIGIPAAYIEPQEIDTLRDEAAAYAEALRDAGTTVEVNEVPGSYHGFDADTENPFVQAVVGRRICAMRAMLDNINEGARI